jgi:transcriptional regulator with XRE-family HTH domain
MRYLSDDYPDICRPKERPFPTLEGVDDLLKRLGQRIRELRTKRGWSQEQFADVCGVHRTHMGHLERGEKNLSFSSIVRVANALDVRLAELFGGLEESSPLTATKSSHGGRRNAHARADLDRPRALRELATLERAVSALRTVLSAGHQGRASRKGQETQSEQKG